MKNLLKSFVDILDLETVAIFAGLVCMLAGFICLCKLLVFAGFFVMILAGLISSSK